MNNRVVVTGMGAITPLGNSVSDFWEGIKSNKNGIDDITVFDASEHKVRIGAEVKDFHPEEWIEKRKRAEWTDSVSSVLRRLLKLFATASLIWNR